MSSRIHTFLLWSALADNSNGFTKPRAADLAVNGVVTTDVDIDVLVTEIDSTGLRGPWVGPA